MPNQHAEWQIHCFPFNKQYYIKYFGQYVCRALFSKKLYTSDSRFKAICCKSYEDAIDVVNQIVLQDFNDGIVLDLTSNKK